MRHSKFLSIKTKFFSSMFLSSVLLIILITLISNLVFLSFFINNQKEFSSKELSYIQKQLEFLVDAVDNYSRTLISDTLIQEFSSEYKKNKIPPDLKAMDYIKTEINHVIQNTKYIHSVSLYDTTSDLLISTDNYFIPLDSHHFTELSGIRFIPSIKKDATTPTSPTYTLSCIRPFYNYFTGEHLGYIELAILESEIRSIFEDHLPDTSHIFLVDQTGLIQSTNSPSPLRTLYTDISNFTPGKQLYYSPLNDFVSFYRFFPDLDCYIINEVSIHFLLSPVYTLIGACLGITLLCIILYIPIAHKFASTITAPILQLIRHTQTIKEGNWHTLDVVQTDTDISLLVEAFNSMVLAQENLKNNLLSAQKAKDQLTLDLLQEQINPHFLYNTLDNICSLAEIGEMDLLNQLIFNLSNFYRKGLSNGQSYITVREELDMIRSYIHIMQIRYYNQFDFIIDCPDTLLNYPCLKFLLQPIVENSIYHGIKPLTTKGLITIIVSETHNSLRFTVTDNGTGFSTNSLDSIWNDTSSHFGLRNIHHRIKLHYGESYGLHLSPQNLDGCTVTITLNKEGGN